MKSTYSETKARSPMPSNLEQMIQLADAFFEAKNDPAQISVTEQVMERLRAIHPASLSEQDDGTGEEQKQRRTLPLLTELIQAKEGTEGWSVSTRLADHPLPHWMYSEGRQACPLLNVRRGGCGVGKNDGITNRDFKMRSES